MPASSPSVASRLERVGTALLADVLDAMGHRTSFLGPGIGPLDPGVRLAGPAVTIRCERSTPDRQERPGGDYHALFDVLRTRHDGGVLVIAGAEHHSGLWGELLSAAAIARGVAGAVIDGLTRDVTGIAETGLRVFARGVSPLDSAGRQWFADHGCRLAIGDATIDPGDWIVGDELGVVAVPSALVDDALRLAEDKATGESTVRQELVDGDDLATVFDRHGIL
jgi:regulator of RNase E activity RraA